MRNNLIYLADVFDFLQELEPTSIDLVIADPPYNMHKAGWDTFRTEQEYLDFTYRWLDMPGQPHQNCALERMLKR